MSEIRRVIGEEIRRHEVIPFARFMELALYCPVYGFYEKESDTIGRNGHYFTSVSSGPLFGELLAGQFATWLDNSRNPAGTALSGLVAALDSGAQEAPAALIEAGAHDGRLALDILNWLRQHRPGLYERLIYSIWESSARRRSWQQRTLAEHQAKVRWLDHRPSRDDNALTIIFSNELLDAFPVHRLSWNAAHGHWVEWGVTIAEDGGFAWAPMPEISANVRPLLPGTTPDSQKPDTLSDGYVIETSPAAVNWWSRAAAALGRGYLVAFDYGLTVEDRFATERTGGTLRAYRCHRVGSDALADPGEQDLTSHVDFMAIQRAGENAGLRTIDLTQQGRFLTRIAAAQSEDGVQWDPARIRQFNTLTHPQHLGATFKVLVQSRP